MAVCLWAELKKAHRRHDLPVALGIGLLALAWASTMKLSDPVSLPYGYSMTLYGLSIINAVVMPLSMAVLGSRLWDVEVRGSACKLLYTLQSRSSLFGAKVILGFAEVLAAPLLELGGVLLFGRVYCFTEPLSPAPLLWFFFCTLAVNALLFFFELMLSILFENQIPALGCGVLFSMTGLFAMFMPPAFTRLLPWAYYAVTLAVGMVYDESSRISTFFPLPYPVWALALVVALCGLVLFLGWRMVRGKEV